MLWTSASVTAFGEEVKGLVKKKGVRFLLGQLSLKPIILCILYSSKPRLFPEAVKPTWFQESQKHGSTSFSNLQDVFMVRGGSLTGMGLK